MLTASETKGKMANGEIRRSASQSLAGILVCCVVVVVVPFVFIAVLRMLFLGAPIVIIGGILIAIASYLEGRE